MVYFSRNESVNRNVVAFISNKNMSQHIESYRAINDWIVTIHICGKLLNITIIQVYAPTADKSEAEIEQFYAKVQNVLNETPKKNLVYIMGDFNAKVGEGEDDVIGKFRLEKRNEVDNCLVQFCQENCLQITNTYFIQSKRCLYTWIHPDGSYRNQIDFLLCQQQWKTSVSSIKTLPVVDYSTDKQLLIANLRLKLYRVKIDPVQLKFDFERIPVKYMQLK